MTKKDRAIIQNKYQGRCAFCGHPLGKGWHTWDIEPVKTVVQAGGELKAVNTELENMLPACKPCGSLRIKNRDRKMDIEEFRATVYRNFTFLKGGGITQSSYGQSIRFGLIKETGNPVIFYFEKVGSKN